MPIVDDRITTESSPVVRLTSIIFSLFSLIENNIFKILRLYFVVVRHLLAMADKDKGFLMFNDLAKFILNKRY